MVFGKGVKVEIDWGMLESIAEYYEFPTAVFLLKDRDALPDKTRHEAVLKKMREFRNKLNVLFDEYLGD